MTLNDAAVLGIIVGGTVLAFLILLAVAELFYGHRVDAALAALDFTDHADDALAVPAQPLHAPTVQRADCFSDCYYVTCPCGMTTGHRPFGSALLTKREHEDAAALATSP